MTPTVAGLALAVVAALASAVAAQPAPDWPTFRDGGVQLSHPPRWVIGRDATTGRVTIQGGSATRLVIWPFFVNGALDATTAGRVLTGMAKTEVPGVDWGRTQPVGRNALRTDGRAGAAVMAASLAWTPSAHGTAAQFVLASAPPERNRDIADAFARILASVRLTGEAGAAPARGPGVAFVPFRDPSEGAFTLDVPRGWRVTGGLRRLAPVDVRSSVVASSPDDTMHLRIGDAELPTFSLPTPQLTARP